jgi:hypothetical protein
MEPWLAEAVVRAAGAYVAAGLAFALAFVTTGVGRIDPAAHAATIGFRLVIVPGVVAFWPLLAFRWASGVTAPPVERNAHRRMRRSPPQAAEVSR